MLYEYSSQFQVVLFKNDWVALRIWTDDKLLHSVNQVQNSSSIYANSSIKSYIISFTSHILYSINHLVLSRLAHGHIYKVLCYYIIIFVANYHFTITWSNMFLSSRHLNTHNIIIIYTLSVYSHLHVIIYSSTTIKERMFHCGHCFIMILTVFSCPPPSGSLIHCWMLFLVYLVSSLSYLYDYTHTHWV